MSIRQSFGWTRDVVGRVPLHAAMAGAMIAAFATPAARASFVYAPIGEPILSASLVLDTAGFTAHRTLFGHEVNTLRLFHAGDVGQSFDLSDQLFGPTIWPDAPLVDQGSFGTGWLSAAIDPSFFGVLAAGNIGLAGVLTDTGDGYFAIDTIMLRITTASGSFNAPFTASYGSANDGFGIGLADGANLPGSLLGLLPPGTTGTGFDETISSKAFGTPTPGAMAVALVAAALLRPRRRRGSDASAVDRSLRPVGSTMLLATGLLAAGAVSVEASAALPNLNGVRALRTHVPVIVNLYPGCNVTPAQAREAVKAANRVFRRSRAGIEMHVVVNPAPATGGDAGGDGVVTVPNTGDGEFEQFLRAGRKEIRERLAGGKGFKISFVKEVEVQETDGTWTTTDGVSAVGTPVAIVERQSDAEGEYDPAQTGALLAHETFHALGLGPGHRVDPATPGNPGVADGGGHVDAATHPHNVLTPTVTSDSYNLTTSQAAAVRRNRHRVGDCATQFDQNYPGGALPQQRAAPTSTGGGFADLPGYLVLDDALIASDDGETDIRCELLLADPFGGEVDVLYAFAFDSDDDPTSGVEWAGMSGVDHILELHVTGSGGRYDLSAEARDTSDGSVSPIEGATIEEIVPLSDGDLPHAPIAARLAVELPKVLVGLPPALSPMSPSVVPVGLAILPTGGPAAMTMMEYHLREWMERPSFTTYGHGVPTPGAAYPISIAGLTPNASFEVLVDDDVIYTGTLDGDGGFTGDVPFPADVTAVTAHAIAAQDENGAVAGSVTCPEDADQLHAVETPPLEVALDSLPSVTATLEHAFAPLGGLPITFHRLAGGVEFARGERSDDGETSVIFTDDDGRAEMIFAPTSPGLVLVSMSMSDLEFPAYAFFEVVAAPIAVAADLNGDGAVNAADLGLLLGAWGTLGGANGLGDLDADGIVAAGDLAILLGAWTG